MLRLYAGIFLSVVAGAAFAQPAAIVTSPTPATLIVTGRALAVENCGSCHAITKTGPSPNRRSPPLRTLRQKYPIETLSEAFAEGILVGHSGMPEFSFEPAQVDALLAYIESIQTRPTKRLKKRSR